MKSGVFCCCFINHFLLLLAFERGCVWLCSSLIHYIISVCGYIIYESIQTSEHVQLLRNYVLDLPNELCL